MVVSYQHYLLWNYMYRSRDTQGNLLMSATLACEPKNNFKTYTFTVADLGF